MSRFSFLVPRGNDHTTLALALASIVPLPLRFAHVGDPVDRGEEDEAEGEERERHLVQHAALAATVQDDVLGHHAEAAPGAVRVRTVAGRQTRVLTAS